jgi:tetraacyldisaccharide 4'-kinase
VIAALARRLFDPIRAIDLPDATIIGVGGATLGGSGRTPLAIAVAEATGGILVSHGYGGRVREPRFVSPDDDPCEVGDEAVIGARAVPTIVGSRASALSFAAKHARVVVVDRLLQTRPRRLSLSLLAVDEEEPFGWLPREPFLSACDLVVPVTRDVAIPVVSGRVGVVTSMARPHRLRSALARRGIVPHVFIERRDHAPLHNLTIFDRRDVDVWLVDSKTHVHLRGRRPALLIEHRAVLPNDLRARLVLTSRAA